MKISRGLRTVVFMVVSAGIIAGCAGTTEEAPTGDAQAAIDAAKAANKIAAAEAYEWNNTRKIIKKAEKALKKGDDAKAIKLANKARREAENAVKQKYSELERIKGFFGDDTGGGTAAGRYTVAGGDNLWNISGKSEIYGNPYQWPLIYKANSDQIKDADLIYPGQNLAIDQNPSGAAVNAAVNHAKTRGSWSLGVVEESDKAYLAQ